MTKTAFEAMRLAIADDGQHSGRDYQAEAYRRQVVSERGATCAICRRSDVHVNLHGWWQKPTPGEDNGNAVLLCEHCHGRMRDGLADFRKHVFSKLNPDALRVLNAAFSVALQKTPATEIAYAVAELLAQPELVHRYARGWRGDS